MGAEALKLQGNAGHRLGDPLPACPLHSRAWLQRSLSEVSHVGPLNMTEFPVNPIQLASTEMSYPGVPAGARGSGASGSW